MVFNNKQFYVIEVFIYLSHTKAGTNAQKSSVLISITFLIHKDFIKYW